VRYETACQRRTLEAYPDLARRFRFPGRKPLDYRKILTGILFVLKTGIAWDDLPSVLRLGYLLVQ
jgi:hypothetical protein